MSATRKVLIVEDNPITRKMFRVTIERAGYAAVEAPDGRTAISLARREMPGIILQDLLLPDIGGVDLMRELRRLPGGKELPILAVSGLLTRVDEARSSGVGFTGYLIKPVEPSRLVQAIESYIGPPRAAPGPDTELRGEMGQNPAFQSAQLSVLAGVSEVLTRTQDIEKAIGEILYRYIDATSEIGTVSTGMGAVYLFEQDRRLVLRAQLGFDAPEQRKVLEDPVFVDLLHRALADAEIVSIPSDELLKRAEVRSMLLIPLIAAKDRLGVIVMGSRRDGIAKDMITFARAISGQVAQAIALARALAKVSSSERRSSFLAESSLVLSNSLDYQATLATVARLAVPRLADWCVVDVIGEDQSIHRLAVAHADPAMEKLGRVLQRYPPRSQEPFGLAKVLTTGNPEILSKSEALAIAGRMHDPEYQSALKTLGLECVMSVPLAARGTILGALSFISNDSKRQYGPDDVRFAMDLARRAAVAIDNARLYRKAQEAIQLRDEFLLVASHELKTPITPLRLRIQMLLRTSRFDERTLEALKTMDRQIDRLSKLVEDLLAVSRFSLGKPHLDRESADLAELVREVAAQFEGEARVVGSEIGIRTEGPLCGNWDVLRIKQVIGNLLSNAIRYGEGKPIDLFASAKDDSAVLIVEDHGLGIARKDQGRIFERFERAASTRHYGGLGLGLYLARQIVEAHGGEIRVESDVNRGSRFVIRLPLSA